MSNYKQVKSHRNLKKAILVACLGGKCNRCGYDKCFQALDLHHVDPSKKVFHVCGNLCKNFEEVITEAEKCVLLCALCHREFHAGIWQLDEIELYKFNRQPYEDHINEVTLKKSICSCGTEFIQHHKNHLYCSQLCGARSLRKVERPSKEELSSLLWSHPMTKIGIMFGVSDRSIKKWADSYNLNCPPRGYFLNKTMG